MTKTLFNLVDFTSASILTPIHDPYWDEIVLDAATPVIEESGQISLLYDDTEEPPDPDDFADLEQFNSAWREWESKHPELASQIDSVGFSSIEAAPELRVKVLEQLTPGAAPEPIIYNGAGWVEQYKITKENHKEYHYFRYCWRQEAKIQHLHIPGGGAKSPIVMERVDGIRSAIATGKSPAEIKDWVKGGFKF